MRRPFLVPTLVFALGILVSEYVPVRLSPCVLLVFALFPPAWLLRGTPGFRFVLLVLIFLLAVIDHRLAISVRPSDISHVSLKEDEHAAIVGVIDSAVYVKETGRSKRQSFTLTVQSVRRDGVTHLQSGRLAVTLLGASDVLEYGERVRLWGVLAVPHRARNPGAFDYRAYLDRQGIYRTLTVIGTRSVRVLEKGKGGWRETWVAQLRKKISARLDRLFSFPERAILKALLVGERRDIPYETRDRFVRTGTIHILSISGLHIALLAGFWYAVWRYLGTPQKVNAAVTVIVILMYMQLAGLRIPVARAALMGVLFYGAALVGSDRDGLNSLAFAAAWILLANTRWLFSISFQLSFLCVLSIMLLASPIETCLRRIPWIFLRKSISVSLATLVGAEAIICFYFSTISPISVLANIVVVPAMVFSVVGGFFSLGFGTIPWAGPVLVHVTEWATTFMLIANRAFARIPFGHWHVPTPSLQTLMGYYVVLVLLWQFRHRLRKKRGWIGGACAVLVIAVMVMAFRPDPKLSVTALDVKQNGIYLIRAPAGKHILVNTGPGIRPNVARWTVTPFLKSRGIHALEACIITGRGKRYWGALSQLAHTFSIRNVFVSAQAGAHKDFPGEMRRTRIQKLKHETSVEGFFPLAITIYTSSSGHTAVYGEWDMHRFLILTSVDRALIKLLMPRIAESDTVFLFAREENTPAYVDTFLARIRPSRLMLSGPVSAERYRAILPDTEVFSTLKSGALTLWAAPEKTYIEEFIRA